MMNKLADWLDPAQSLFSAGKSSGSSQYGCANLKAGSVTLGQADLIGRRIGAFAVVHDAPAAVYPVRIDQPGHGAVHTPLHARGSLQCPKRRLASRRQPVPDREALRESNRLELANIGFEPRGVHANFVCQTWGSHARGFLEKC